MILARNGIIPPREWMHDYKILNSFNEGIKNCLRHS